jgi:hypothetical protein
MHEMVRSNLHNRLRSSARLPSFAGKGLPERMRSTAFAFLGLTAAAGLALVAIFAQLGFPLLSPAPMPSDPSQANAVAEGEALEGGSSSPRTGAVAPARNAVAASQLRGGGDAADPQGQGTRGGEAGVDAPSAPVSTPDPGSVPDAAEPTETPVPAPEPSPTPSPVPTASTPEPEPEAAPAAPPAPEAKTAGSKPPKVEAKPAKSKPPKVEARPAKSNPASPEAKPAKVKPEKSTKPEAKPAPEPAYEAAPPPPSAPVEKDKDEEKGKGKK